MGFVNPIPTLEEALNNYGPEYIQYHPRKGKLMRQLYQLYIKRKAMQIRDLIGNEGNILEVGCGLGESIKILSKYGNWNIIGLEPIDYPIEAGKKIGVKILKGTLETLSKESSERYDLILMLHVLEHVPDPIGDLKNAYNLLKPGGYIIGETENIFSWDFKCLRRYWGLLGLPRHLSFFSPDVLKFIAEIAGFDKVVDINYALNTEGWALGVQFLIQERLIKKHIKKRAFYYPLLLVLFMPIVCLQKLFKVTGVIEFIFRKPRNER